MSSIFSVYHEHLIDIHEFLDAGWSVKDYLKYRDLCSEIRAGIILADTSDVNTSSILRIAIAKLSDRINNTILGDFLELDQNFIDALSAGIRYMSSDNYVGVGILPTFYLSEEDFRQLIEHSVYDLLHPQSEISEDCFLFCSTKQNAVSLQQAYLDERQKVLESIDFDIPDDTSDSQLSNWAKKKSNDIHRIIEIDSILDNIQNRIDELNGDSIFNASKNCLYVYKGFIKCIREDHNSICVNASIPCADGKTAFLNVTYCTVCKQFYISYEEYTHYLNVYGSLLAKIVLISNDASSPYKNNLAEESPLKLCGYSVSREKGLTTQIRQTILRTVIHNNIMKKSDVMRYLHWFITVHGSKFGNELAKKKWEDDLHYVRALDSGSQSNRIIDDISIYGKFGQFVRD